MAEENNSSPMEIEVQNNNKKTLELSPDRSDVTPITPITPVTAVTAVTPYLPVTAVTCNTYILQSLFGEETSEQIFKELTLANKPLTIKFLADKLNKTEVNIRNVLSRKKDYFGRLGQNGQICYTYLLQVAIDDLEERISSKKAEIAHKLELEKITASIRNEGLEFEEEVKKFSTIYPPERVGNKIMLDFQKLLEYSYKLADELFVKPIIFLQNYKNSFEGNYEVELTNLPHNINIPIERIRKENLNKIVCVEGRVTSFGEVKPVITKIKFECPSCGTIITVLQNYRTGDLREPSKCSCGRKGGFNQFDRDEENACFLQLEDLQDNTDNPHSQRIRAVIFGDLCEHENIRTFSPGNEIRVVGILKEVPIIKKGKQTVFLNWILEIMSAELIEKEIDILNLSDDELKEISQLNNQIDKNGFDIINSSFAPDVHGYDSIKSALALQLCNKRNDKKISSSRTKSNILLIGDPGVAKSVLCDFAVSVTNGARKAVGGGSSAVGITASVVKEEESLGGYRVEPGAMILAKELLFIDELNNLQDEDKPKLQEGMSEQQVSINKANLHVQMKVTSGVIAAANPKGGHFNLDGNETIESQFNIPTPILNRFDSIFVLQDELDEIKDKKIAAKMIQRHRGLLKHSYNKDFLRKFFTFVRRLPSPTIDDETEKHLISAYHLARNRNSCRVKINARFLESLTRMVIASAKIRNSSKVELKDIERCLNIMADTEYKINPFIINNLKEPNGQ